MNAKSRKPRWAVWVLTLAVILVPLVAWGVRRAILSNANDVRDWLPAHYPETRQFHWFQQHFGNDDFVIVSWPGCTLDDPRLDRYAVELRQRIDARAAVREPPLLQRVVTGRELFDQLALAPSELPRRTITSRLRGTLIGPDAQQTGAVVTLHDAAHTHLQAALDELVSAAEAVGLPRHEVHMGGPPVVNAAIDQSSTQSLVRLAVLAGVIGVWVAWLCFRSWRLTWMVFAVSTYSSALSLAMVPLLGIPLNAILVTMVPLVYVAAMSGAIHLTNYYRDAQRTASHNPVVHALKHAALPLGLATGTTAIGLLSLEFSDLAPIRFFGLFSALGVLIGLGVQYGLLPALLSCWPETQPRLAAVDGPPPAEASTMPAWAIRLASGVIRRYRWFSAVGLVLLVVGGWGLSRVHTTIQIMRLFSSQTPILASYAWLEQRLGALVPLEVVLKFQATDERTFAERLSLVRQVQRALRTVPDVGGSLSAATFVPALPDTAGHSIRSIIANRRLLQFRSRLLESGYLAEGDGDGGELWRISVRVNAGSDLDYDAFRQHLHEVVAPLLTAGPEPQPVDAIFTGAVPIIYKARRSLLDGLMLGFGTDIVLIVVAVMVALRQWSSGLLMLVTSVFPMAVVFGGMGWLGIAVDIGSVMTPCVALGVTVDDVFHFLLWFRRGIGRGLNSDAAVLLAYEGCGRAMVQSWGVIGLGLSAFALSSFVPTFRFGALMIALLTAGLVCNLVFLPALLAGPLGKAIAAYGPRSARGTSPAISACP